jgi:hypothetical protein
MIAERGVPVLEQCDDPVAAKDPRRPLLPATNRPLFMIARPLPLCIALLLAASAPRAMAQWSPYPDVNTPVVIGPGDQVHPLLVTDQRNGAIVVWEESDSNDIAAQRLSASGVARWPSGGAPVVSHAAAQRLRAAVSDGRSGVIVVWDDDRNPMGMDVLAQRLDTAGRARWPAPTVVCGALWNQHEADAVSDGLEGIIAVWQDARLNGYTLFAQRLDRDGKPMWQDEGVLVCNQRQSQVLPHLAPDGRGGAFIAWEDGRNAGASGGDIYAQHVTADGRLAWPATGMPVSCAAGTQKAPRLSADAQGGAVLVWQDHRSGVNDADIYTQRLDSAGQPLWLLNGVLVCSAPNAQTAPRLTRDSAGGFVACWTDERNTYTERVFLQRLLPNGAMQWAPNGVDASPTGQGSRLPALMADDLGGVFVTWQDSRAGAGNLNIYAQRFDAAGNRLWAVTGVAICNAAGNQTAPQICPGSGGGAIIAWEDRRDGVSADIFASFVSAGGIIPVTLVAFHAEADGDGVLLRWETAAETDNAGFDVQRAAGAGDWETAAFVPGGGTGPGRSYAYRDHPPAGTEDVDLRYRLLQHDLDGTMHFSPVCTVARGSLPAVFRIGVFPSPAAGPAQFTLTLPDDAVVTVRLCDALGRSLVDLLPATPLARGTHVFPLPLERLSPGVYIVEARSTRDVKRARFVRR